MSQSHSSHTMQTSAEDQHTYRVVSLTDAGVLAQRLIAPPDNLSRFVCERLGDAARSALQAWDSSRPVPPEVQTLLVADLNRLIAGPLLFDKERFARIDLKEPTKALVEECQPDARPSQHTLRRCNLALLCDAYPQLQRNIWLRIQQVEEWLSLFRAVVAKRLRELTQQQLAPNAVTDMVVTLTRSWLAYAKENGLPQEDAEKVTGFIRKEVGWKISERRRRALAEKRGGGNEVFQLDEVPEDQLIDQNGSADPALKLALSGALIKLEAADQVAYEAFVRVVIEGHTMDEVGRQNGTSKVTVFKRVQRAKEHLRADLELLHAAADGAGFLEATLKKSTPGTPGSKPEKPLQKNNPADGKKKNKPARRPQDR